MRFGKLRRVAERKRWELLFIGGFDRFTNFLDFDRSQLSESPQRVSASLIKWV